MFLSINQSGVFIVPLLPWVGVIAAVVAGLVLIFLRRRQSRLEDEVERVKHAILALPRTAEVRP